MRMQKIERGRRPAVSLLTVLFAAAAPAAQQPPPAPSPTPIVGGGPVRSPGNADWAASLEEARARATAKDKLVFVEFDRAGCGNCQRMDSLLYPAFDFEALLIPMVPVKVDLGAPDGMELARRYGIDEAPAVLITTPEGRLVFRMQGFQNTPNFYGHVHQDLDLYRRFARRVEGQGISKLPAREALETGRELYQRLDPEAALPRLERVLAASDAAPAMRDEAREILAAVEFDLGQTAVSRKQIDILITQTRDAARRERAELFRAQIPLAEGRPGEALKLYREFQKDHPQSRYISQVESIIHKIEMGATAK